MREQSQKNAGMLSVFDLNSWAADKIQSHKSNGHCAWLAPIKSKSAVNPQGGVQGEQAMSGRGRLQGHSERVSSCQQHSPYWEWGVAKPGVLESTPRVRTTCLATSMTAFSTWLRALVDSELSVLAADVPRLGRKPSSDCRALPAPCKGRGSCYDQNL